MNMIEVSELRKSFGSVQAVRGLSFYVPAGGLFAFLGPNGAGKSTTIDMICTFLQPDSGSAVVDGHILGRENAKIRRSIGVVFQDSVLDRLLTAEENLRCRGALYGLKGGALKSAVHAALAAVDGEALARRPYGTLSGGQRRRVDIARALVHTPKVLFLDEPTTGLDPQTRAAVWETVAGLRRRTGMTVFLTTHYMEEAEQADYVMIVDEGRTAAQGTPAALREQYARDRLLLRCKDQRAVEAALAGRGLTLEKKPGQVCVRLDRTLDALPILDACRELILGFEVTAGRMDDAFLSVTGKEMRN